MNASIGAHGRRLGWWPLALALLSITCGDPVTGPHGSNVAQLRIAPAWPAAIAPVALVASRVDNVRIRLRRADAPAFVDTTVVFPAGVDSLQVAIRVELRSASEQLTATLEMREGTTVLFSGTQQITATSGSAGIPVPPVPVVYVGVGSDATSVTVTPADTSIASRDSLRFSAVARNAQSSVVAAPVTWSVLPEGLGTIDTSGHFRGVAQAGAVTISATTPTGVVGTTTLTLAPTLQGLEIVSGNGQSKAPGVAFDAPLVARAVDGQTPVPGTIVSWAVTNGLAQLSAAADTADANGLVQVSVTADTLATPITVRASVGATVVDFALTVTAGVPALVELIAGGGQSVNAGLALPVRPTVRVRDQYNNVTPGVNVIFAVGAGGGSLGTPDTVATNALGEAEGPVWTLGPGPGSNRLDAYTYCPPPLRTEEPSNDERPKATPRLAAGCLGVEVFATGLLPPAMTLTKISGDLQAADPGSPLAAPLVVRVENSGSPVANVPVAFSVLTGGGLLAADTVLTNASGDASVSYSAGVVGAQLIRANVSSLQVDFTATGTPVGFTHLWLGTTTNWHAPSNWSAGTVPTSTDSVYIATTASVRPQLSGAATTATLVMDDPRGIDLQGFVLQAFGSVSSVAAWSGTGRLEMLGANGSLSGTVPKTSIRAQTWLTGATSVGDTLWVRSGSVLIVGPQTLSVQGALQVIENSHLQMTDAAGVVTVGGNALFNTSDMGDTRLTAGLLDLQGNFTATTSAFQSFRATGTHVTRFSGAGLQSISIGYPATNQSRFQRLELANAAGVQLLSHVVAHSDVTVSGTTALSESGARILYVGGALTTAAGTALGISGVNIYAGTGPQFPAIGGTYPTTLRLQTGGLVLLTQNVAVTNHLVIESGTTFAVDSFAITVGGNVTVQSSGFLRMTDAAGVMTIGGNTVFNTSDMGDAQLTAGLLDLKGNFTATTSAFQSFRATGTHVTRFSGAGLQTVSVGYPATNQSRFQRLELANAAGVQLLSHVVAHSDVTVTGTTALSESGARILYVGGALTTAAGTTLGISGVNIYAGTGPQFPAIGGTYPATLRLQTGGLVPLTQNVAVTGNLEVENGTTFAVDSFAITVGGNVAIEASGKLRMTHAAGVMTISGSATFNSADMGDSLMTAGLLDLKGNFSATTSAFQSFRATGTHVTRFSGSAPQTISVGYPATNQSRFQRLELANAAGVQLLSHVVAHSDVTVSGTTALSESGARILYVGGALTTAAGTALGISGVNIYAGTGPQFPAIGGTYPTTLRLQTGGLVLLTQNVTVTGNLEVENGTTFAVDSFAITVGGNVTVQSSGLLRMTDAAGVMTIGGNTVFNTSDMGDAQLTAGLLDLKGNFTATTSAFQSFRATGTHVTRFSGTGLQTISFGYPAVGQSRFQTLEITNITASGVSLASNAYVAGGVQQSGQLTVPASRTLTIAGQLTLGSASFTEVFGSISFGSCVDNGAEVITGFSCLPP